MSTSTISPVTGASSADTAPTSGSRDSLGQDAFLQLLTTQLAHQDPLQPMDNQAYIAQLAQFSSLEQLTQMNQNIQALVALLAMQQLGASSTDTSTTAGNSTATGDGTSTAGGI